MLSNKTIAFLHMETALTYILNCCLGLMAASYIEKSLVVTAFWLLLGLGNTFGGWNTCQILIKKDQFEQF